MSWAGSSPSGTGADRGQFVASLIVAILLWYTLLGKQLLATAENPMASQLLGVNVERARLFAFGISGALSGLAALFLSP